MWGEKRPEGYGTLCGNEPWLRGTKPGDMTHKPCRNLGFFWTRRGFINPLPPLKNQSNLTHWAPPDSLLSTAMIKPAFSCTFPSTSATGSPFEAAVGSWEAETSSSWSSAGQVRGWFCWVYVLGIAVFVAWLFGGSEHDKRHVSERKKNARHGERETKIRRYFNEMRFWCFWHVKTLQQIRDDISWVLKFTNQTQRKKSKTTIRSSLNRPSAQLSAFCRSWSCKWSW